MKTIHRAAVTLLATFAIAFAGAGPASAVTEHCDEPSITGHIENGSMDNDLVLPAGTVGCVKGSTDFAYFTADGVTDLSTYLGNGHDVSYYVIYAYPGATPSPTPEPTPTPAPTATPSPTPSPSTEPSESPEPSSTPQPSSTPSDSPVTRVQATLPPTDTAATSYNEDAPPVFFLWLVGGLAFIAGLAFIGRDLNWSGERKRRR